MKRNENNIVYYDIVTPSEQFLSDLVAILTQIIWCYSQYPYLIAHIEDSGYMPSCTEPEPLTQATMAC